MLVIGPDIDKMVAWPIGQAAALARKKRLPHVVLPDGSIRFDPEKIRSLLREVSVIPDKGTPQC